MNAKILLPQWMRDVAHKAIRRLDANHNDAIVVVAVALGEDGYSAEHEDDTQVLDSTQAIPLLLEGYGMASGLSLGAILKVAALEIESDEDIQSKSSEDRIDATRQMYEAAIRSWMRSSLTYAGEAFQEDRKADINTMAASQMLGVFIKVAETPFKFNIKGEPSHDGSKQK